MLKPALLLASCSAGLLAFGCSNSSQPESPSLQGTWTGQEVGATGQGSPSLVIDTKNLEFRGANSNEWYKATYSLREDTNPKQLDAVVTDCPAAEYVGKTSHGIYRIEGGKLTLTANEPGNPARPASFDAQGARQIVFTKQP